MDLNERVLAMKPQLLACLQENLRIPSVQGDAEDGAPYGVEVRRSLEHVLSAAEKLGFRTCKKEPGVHTVGGKKYDALVMCKK